jgi:hypothetical protein
MVAVIASAELDDVPKPRRLKVDLHHQGLLGVVRACECGVDRARG